MQGGPQDIACPKCNSGMVEGRAIHFGHSSRAGFSRWVKGRPKASFWKGLHLRGRDQRYITAHRCGKCGYLEFYANEKIQ